MLLKYFRIKYFGANAFNKKLLNEVILKSMFSGKFIEGNLSVVSDMALYAQYKHT